MLRGLGHEQSPELSQMWAGLALLQMCELNSATGAAAGRDLGRVAGEGDFQGDWDHCEQCRARRGHWGHSGQ